MTTPLLACFSRLADRFKRVEEGSGFWIYPLETDMQGQGYWVLSNTPPPAFPPNDPLDAASSLPNALADPQQPNSEASFKVLFKVTHQLDPVEQRIPGGETIMVDLQLPEKPFDPFSRTPRRSNPLLKSHTRFDTKRRIRESIKHHVHGMHDALFSVPVNSNASHDESRLSFDEQVHFSLNHCLSHAIAQRIIKSRHQQRSALFLDPFELTGSLLEHYFPLQQTRLSAPSFLKSVMPRLSALARDLPVRAWQQHLGRYQPSHFSFEAAPLHFIDQLQQSGAPLYFNAEMEHLSLKNYHETRYWLVRPNSQSPALVVAFHFQKEMKNFLEFDLCGWARQSIITIDKHMTMGRNIDPNHSDCFHPELMRQKTAPASTTLGLRGMDAFLCVLMQCDPKESSAFECESLSNPLSQKQSAQIFKPLCIYDDQQALEPLHWAFNTPPHAQEILNDPPVVDPIPQDIHALAEALLLKETIQVSQTAPHCSNSEAFDADHLKPHSTLASKIRL